MSVPRSLVLIALQCLLVFVIGFRLLAPLLLSSPETPFAPSVQVVAFVVLLAALGGLGLVWFASVRQPGRSWAELGWRFDNLGLQLALALGGAAVCIAGELLVLRAAGVPASELLDGLSSATLAERGVFLLIGLQAGFIEESLFRGNLLDALRARLPLGIAVVLSAAIFALYHLNPNPLGLIVKAWFGVVFASLRLRTGSLVAPALAHALTWVMAGAM